MIAVLSIFHNAENYINRYLEQLKDTQQDIYYLFLEGNSEDRTYQRLEEFLANEKGILLKRDKEKIYGSVIDKNRFSQLADLWNELIDLIPENVEKVCFIESDLIFNSETFNQLLDYVDTYSFVCPQIIRKDIFYDIWAYQYTKGNWFKSEMIYLPKEIIPIYSAGSFLMMKSNIAKENRISRENAVIGFCESAKETLYCIPLFVFHP